MLHIRDDCEEGSEVCKKSLPCEEVKEELYRLILRAKLGYKG
jgi:hypothetical protein